MSESLSEVLIRFRRDEARVWAEYQCPVLIWEALGTADAEHWETTSGQTPRTPVVGDPRIFKLVKSDNSKNAFSLGITVGRVENNDLVLEDDSVSRFHAFFRSDDRGPGWFLTDAESKNGTWVNEVKLQPSERTLLNDGDKVRFGDAQLKFLVADSFRNFIEKR